MPDDATPEFEDNAPSLPAERQQSLTFMGNWMALYSALAKAQAEFPEIPRTKTVTIQGAGYSYSFDYSPLDNTQHLIRPILGKHGIAINQPPVTGPNKDFRVVTIMAGHGGAVVGEIDIARVGDIKQQAGLFTYMQRYGYEGMVGVKADTDDDGAAANNEGAKIQDRTPKRRTPDNPPPSQPSGKQRQILLDRGVPEAEIDAMTRQQASDRLDQLLAKKPNGAKRQNDAPEKPSERRVTPPGEPPTQAENAQETQDEEVSPTAEQQAQFTGLLKALGYLSRGPAMQRCEELGVRVPKTGADYTRIIAGLTAEAEERGVAI